MLWCRELKQKRKRDPAISDQPQRTKQKTALNGSSPGGASQEFTDAGAAQTFWAGTKAGRSMPGDDSQWARLTHDSSSHQPSYSVSVDLMQQKRQMNHDPHGGESNTKGLCHDESASPQGSTQYRHVVPGLAEHAQRGSAAEDLNRMVEHLSGHLPDSADEGAGEEEELEGVTEDEDTDMERKPSLPDIDVVN